MSIKKTSKKYLLNALSSPKYRGKHLVIIKNKIFAAKTGSEASKIFKNVIKKYPKEKPTITYVPQEGMLMFNYGIC